MHRRFLRSFLCFCDWLLPSRAMRDERIVSRRPGLKNRLQFEGPRVVAEFPIGVRVENPGCFFMVGLEIRAKINVRIGGGMFSQGAEKIALQDAVFVVPQLRPRIGKKDEDGAEHRPIRKRFKEKSRFGAQEKEIRQRRAVTFAQRAFDPVARHINSDANVFGMRRRIGRQKMPVSRTHFQYEPPFWNEHLRELLLQGFSPLL
jgi:hypothetical protein